MGNTKGKMAEAQEQYDFRDVLNDVWKDLADELELDPVLKELKKKKVFRRRELRDIQVCYYPAEKTHALLQGLRKGDHSRYVQFKRCLGDSGQQRLVDIIEKAEREKYKPAVWREPWTEEEKLPGAAPSTSSSVKRREFKSVVMKKPKGKEKELLEALIKYYLEYESTMSVAPLAEQHDVELTSFYVRPPMMAYKKPNAFGQVKQSTEPEKTKISSYRELLFGDNGTYRKIYVTADAGMGKTSFSKMLARTWCQAHKPDKVVEKKFSKDDLNTMRNFNFLFLIKLRQYQGTDMCCLDDMIVTMLSKLPMASSYTKSFVEQVLCNKRCLVILDGLDEWSHPEHTTSQALPVEVIPHTTRLPGCCSVLTTTRPWKLSDARLSGKDIDRQVEISALDETTARELESRAIEFLNENQRQNDQVEANSKTKTVTDFENSVPEKVLGHIRYIPFMLLQMICLWFENNPIGKSLCEVYSNIIELTLTRWLVKTDSGHTDRECKPSKEHENIKLKCMENNRHCQRYMPLLVKIGEIAFSTLFDVIREESLLFDKEQVLKYLSEEELKQCLDMGLLSQVKDTTCIAKVRLQLYFPHKTLHEYFCALFIVTNWNNTNTGTMSIKQTISNKCTSVSDILEMSEVFVFVCGLNPEVYSDISRHLASIVSTDQSVIDYRNRVEVYMYSLLWGYQRMQISCFLESTRNQHPECRIVIEDMFLGWRYGGMKEDEKLALKSILTSSAHTLKYLRLEYVSLTDDTCSAISTLNNLHVLYLDNVDVSSDRLNAVSDCISGCMSLQKLTLDFRYKSSDTDEKPEQREASINYLLRSIETKTMLTYLRLRVDVSHQNGVLDLPKHDKLQVLYLNLPLTELHINTEQLVTCGVSEMDGFSAAAVSSLLAELHGAPVLETITLHRIRNPPPRIDITALPLLTKFTLYGCDLRGSTVTLTLPLLTKFTLDGCDLRDNTVTLTLPLLTEFTLHWCDLRDSTVTLSPEMTSLETITLKRTTVNIPGYRELFLSISKLPQPITVKLDEIKMIAGEWRELFLSISKLPQPITVELEEIKMTAEEWRELLFDILGKLPKSIHVETQACSGPSKEEWRNIFDDMKASPAFCVTSTDYEVDEWWDNGVDITFDTVVV